MSTDWLDVWDPIQELDYLVQEVGLLSRHTNWIIFRHEVGSSSRPKVGLSFHHKVGVSSRAKLCIICNIFGKPWYILDTF